MAFDPITAIANVANTVLGRVLPDKAANDAAKVTIAEMQLSGELKQYSDQIQVDLAEAQNKSVFVAGWRPFIGWICGCSLAYQFLVQPLLTFGVHLFHGNWAAPSIDISSLNDLLMGMLGLAGMRTAEKFSGVATKTQDSGH